MTEDADCPNCGHSIIVFHAGKPNGPVPPCFASVDAETGEYVEHIVWTIEKPDGSVEYQGKPPDPDRFDNIEFCDCTGTLEPTGETTEHGHEPWEHTNVDAFWEDDDA